MVLHKLMADDPTSYQTATVGLTFKVTAEHSTTQVALLIVQSFYYRPYTSELRDGQLTHLVVYVAQCTKENKLRNPIQQEQEIYNKMNYLVPTRLKKTERKITGLGGKVFFLLKKSQFHRDKVQF